MKKILFILVLVVVLAVVGKNFIAKAAVENGVKAVTGLKLDVKSLNLGLMDTLISVQGLKLHNPPIFKDPIMVDLPDVHIDFNLQSIIGGKAHLEELRLYLRELVVIKGRDGKINLEYLKPAGSDTKPSDKPSGSSEPSQTSTKPKKKMDIQIDELDLKIDKVIYKDYTTGKTQEFNVNISEHHKNITDPNLLVGLILTKALMNTTLNSLINFDPTQLLKNVDMAGVNLDQFGLGNLENALGDVGSTGGGLLSGVKEKLGGLSDQSKEGIKSIFDSLKSASE